MPEPFPKNQQQFSELFKGDGHVQSVAARDALMNYVRLIEKEGKLQQLTDRSGAAAGDKPPATPPVDNPPPEKQPPAAVPEKKPAEKTPEKTAPKKAGD